MKLDKNFMNVIEALGEVLEQKEVSITCQRYEIDRLKETISNLEDKLKGSE